MSFLKESEVGSVKGEGKMTNDDKRELRELVREEGLSFSEIREIVDCADATIRRYIKVFQSKKKGK